MIGKFMFFGFALLILLNTAFIILHFGKYIYIYFPENLDFFRKSFRTAKDRYVFKNFLVSNLQRRIQNRIKYLKWKPFRKISTINYFRKKTPSQMFAKILNTPLICPGQTETNWLNKNWVLKNLLTRRISQICRCCSWLVMISQG